VWSYDFVEDRTHDGRKYRMLMRITAKPDSDYDRCRTALRRKPDSNPKEAGQHLDEAGHCRPSTYG
jgi:hypothetical protein